MPLCVVCTALLCPTVGLTRSLSETPDCDTTAIARDSTQNAKNLGHRGVVLRPVNETGAQAANCVCHIHHTPLQLRHAVVVSQTCSAAPSHLCLGSEWSSRRSNGRIDAQAVPFR
jgi:hypothetical protein